MPYLSLVAVTFGSFTNELRLRSESPARGCKADIPLLRVRAVLHGICAGKALRLLKQGGAIEGMPGMQKLLAS